jgi:hypothetical protein
MYLPQTDILDREAIELAYKGATIHLPAIDSLGEAIELADGKKSAGWKGDRDSKSTHNPSWYKTAGWAACKKLIADGWVEGREKVAANLAAIFASGAAELSCGDAVAHEVGGAYPDVPLYVAGEVCHMVNDGDQLGEKPIIKLIVNTAANCSITGERLINRGAAITALVDEIESAGNSCEIIATWPAKARRGGAFYAPMVRIKAAGEIVPIDDLAFALGHPSMVRRVFFGLLEVDPKTDGHGFEDGYGIPCDIPADALPADAIYLRGVVHDGRQYDSAEDAMAIVREIYNKQADEKGLTVIEGGAR